MSARRFAAGLALVVAAGLGVRIAYTLVVDPRVNPVSDATTYHLLANHAAAGEGWVRPYDLERGHVHRPTAEFPPLYPALLTIVSVAGAKSVLAQRLATCVIGAATVGLSGVLGRRVAGPAVGLVAAAVVAVDPMLFQSDATLMAESLFAFLVVAALLVAYRADDRPTWRGWAALGAVVGLAALTRGEGLLLVVLLVVPLAGRRRGPAAIAAVAIALAAFVVVLAPWTVRNARTFHAFVPVSNNTGTLLAGANCASVYRGYQTGLWRLDCTDGIDTAGLDEVHVAARYRSAGLRYARAHVADLPKVVAVRWLRAFALFRPGQQVDYETLEGRDHRYQTLGVWLWWAVAPVAVAGAALLRRRRERVWLLACPLALASVTAVATYGNERFREAAQPAVAVLAAVALVAGWAQVRRLGSRANAHG